MSCQSRRYHGRLIYLCTYSLGSVDPDTVEKVEVEITDMEKARQERIANRPPLSEILNLHDFEVCIHGTLAVGIGVHVL